MFDIFQMAFMQRALVIAIFISIVTPLIGNTIVLKRLSSIGDALSHAGLAGVAIGLCFSWSPVVSAIVFSVISALIIEYIRRGFPNYSEMATAIVLSFGVGVAAVFSGFIKNAASFNSFLFGSIVAVSTFELVVVVVLSIAVIIILVLLYRELFYIAFDEESAALSGVPVKSINLIFTILTSIVVSIAARTVGCSMLISKSYKQNVIFSVIFAFIFTIAGLLITAVYDLKPGGTIVLIGIAFLIVLLLLRKRK